MNKVFSSLMLLTIAATLAGCGTSVQPASLPAQHGLQGTENFSFQDETPRRWYVEFDSTKAQGIAAQGIETLARQQGIEYSVNYRYTSLFNGMSVTATSGNIEAIADLQQNTIQPTV